VAKARKGQLLRLDRAAGAIGGLDDDDAAARFGEADRGSEPVGPAADDDRRAGQALTASCSFWAWLITFCAKCAGISS
jgi:hypothetical protein